MARLIAKKPCYYAGRTHPVGEVFEAIEGHARLLVLAGAAERQEPEAPRQRRQYRRRDMQAEA